MTMRTATTHIASGNGVASHDDGRPLGSIWGLLLFNGFQRWVCDMFFHFAVRLLILNYCGEEIFISISILEGSS